MALNRTEAESLRKHLRAALEILDNALEPLEISPEVQAEVESKLAKRICLAWDHEIEEGERVLRGVCETDYHTTMARIRRGDESERELIQQGKLLPPSTGGRKAQRDQALPDKLAERVEKYNKKQAAKRKKKSGE